MPLVAVPEDEWLGSNTAGFAIAGTHPVAPDHGLVIRHRLIKPGGTHRPASGRVCGRWSAS
jgi:hypothetical protein